MFLSVPFKCELSAGLEVIIARDRQKLIRPSVVLAISQQVIRSQRPLACSTYTEQSVNSALHPTGIFTAWRCLLTTTFWTPMGRDWPRGLRPASVWRTRCVNEGCGGTTCAPASGIKVGTESGSIVLWTFLNWHKSVGM